METLKQSACSLEEDIRNIERTLGGLATGKLYIQRRKNKSKVCYRRCYYDENGTRTIEHLSRKDKALINQLAERAYLTELIAVMKNELSTVKNFIQRYTPEEKTSVWPRLAPDIRELVAPRFISADEEDRIWREEEYEKSDYHSENAFIKTLNGDMVRSKTEALIADMLLHKGISYRYEAALHLSSFYTCYPDFTIRRKSDGRIFYWEHLGLLDDPGYLESAIYKINQYARAGIILGDNLFITWETSAHPFDRTAAEKYIRRLCI